MSYQDIQQVCLNGHQITDSHNSSPEHRQDFCTECGAATITACPECRNPIKGDYITPGVFVACSTPVPEHCEHCGTSFPWAKNRSSFRFPLWLWISNFSVWHKRLLMIEKIGLWGSVASVISLGLYFFPSQAPAQTEPKSQVITSGEQSPAIGINQGSVTFNIGASSPQSKKSYVLRNGKGGATLVVSQPDLSAAMDPKRHVCMAIAGTSIAVIPGATAKMNGTDIWRKVQIMSGECTGSVGWVALENISYE